LRRGALTKVEQPSIRARATVGPAHGNPQSAPGGTWPKLMKLIGWLPVNAVIGSTSQCTPSVERKKCCSSYQTCQPALTATSVPAGLRASAPIAMFAGSMVRLVQLCASVLLNSSAPE